MDRLGKRLALHASVATADRELLEAILEAYDDVLAATVDRLRPIVRHFNASEGADVSLTTRVKTTLTVREKLRREHGMGLKGMQDIAGARLAAEMSRIQQDRLGRLVSQEFADEPKAPAWIDRRVTPSHGYRALHVVVHPLRIPVEVQIRTAGQDLWAQLVERLGDRWGRQIRYGGSPPAPARQFASNITQGELWDAVLRFGESLARAERYERVRDLADKELEDLSAYLDRDADHSETLSDLSGRIAETRDDLRDTLADVVEERRQVQASLEALVSALEAMSESPGSVAE